MPKIVDPVQRREAVVDSVLSVIEAGGLDAATLSSVAEHAGLSIGSVRHYFSSHDELLRFAADALTQRIGDRLGARVSAFSEQADAGGTTILNAVLELLLEVLPIDATRRRESTVWLEYAVASRTRPNLVEKTDYLFYGLAQISRRVVDGAVTRGTIAPEAAESEAERLHALLDGLAMHGVLSPSADFAERATSIVRIHLAGLLAPRPSAP